VIKGNSDEKMSMAVVYCGFSIELFPHIFRGGILVPLPQRDEGDVVFNGDEKGRNEEKIVLIFGGVQLYKYSGRA
jgi:hypothetical protein